MHFVVSFMAIKYLFEQYINLRQMKFNAIRELPDVIEKLGITPKSFKRQQKLNYDKLAFEMYTKSIRTALDVIIIVCHVMPFVWEKSVAFFGLDPQSEFQRGLAYIFLESVRQKLIEVPNNFYNSYVIEQRYGLSQMSFSLQFSDLVVESGIMCILVPLFLYGYLYVVETGGEYFFLYVFIYQKRVSKVQIFVLIFAIAQSLIYPNYIQPLFNKFEELNDGLLKFSINELTRRLKFKIDQIYVMDGSKRSDHSNAYLFGLINKRIVLYDTLLKKLNDKEILAVVAHEIGHWRWQHPYINLMLYCLKILFTFYLFGLFRNSDQIFLSFGFSDKSIFIGSTLFFAVFEPMNQLFHLLELMVSRSHEYQADQFACQLGYGQELFSALIKSFSQDSSNLLVDPWYQWYYNSHPTLFERLDYIKKKI